MATNVPQIQWTPTGFVLPLESAVLAGVQENINDAFGGVLNFKTAQGAGVNATPQNQLASSEAAEIGNVNDTFLMMQNQVDPAYNSGRWQDAIARIYDLERNPSQPTVLQVPCVGLQGVPIPVGASILDESNYQYVCTQAGTIPGGGSITLPFANLTPGPIAVPGEFQVRIYQTIPGWDAVSVSSGVLGNDTESAGAFRARRAASVALNSNGSLPSVRGAVLAVPNVIDAYVTENDENTSQTIGGYSLVANSIYVAVVGGTAAAVAQAIWSSKGPGCAYNGNTSVVVYDTSRGYQPPYPAYTVVFETPEPLTVLFAVNIANGPLVPANAAALIQAAILSAFAGGDGGPRATIGSTIYASRFYAPVAALGAWVQIISIQVGSAISFSSAITGSISGTTLTTASTISGAVAIGQTLVDFSGAILPGTTVTGGSDPTWTVSQNQTVALENMWGVLANQNDQTAQIDMVPVTYAGDVVVTLT